jgi:hypothetical protein
MKRVYENNGTLPSEYRGWIIYECMGDVKMTTVDNYNARIQDARLIYDVSDFKNYTELTEYIDKYMVGGDK